MKKQFVVLCAVLLAVSSICLGQVNSPQSQKATAKQTAEATLVDLEKAAWEAYKNKQADAFKKLLDKDYYGLYAEGIKNVDTEVADMAKTELQSYSFADAKVTFPKPAVAVMTYKVTGQGTFAGKDMSGTYNAASVYVQRQGKWFTVFHTEVKVQ